MSASLSFFSRQAPVQSSVWVMLANISIFSPSASRSQAEKTVWYKVGPTWVTYLRQYRMFRCWSTFSCVTTIAGSFKKLGNKKAKLGSGSWLTVFNFFYWIQNDLISDPVFVTSSSISSLTCPSLPPKKNASIFIQRCHSGDLLVPLLKGLGAIHPQAFTVVKDF